LDAADAPLIALCASSKTTSKRRNIASTSFRVLGKMFYLNLDGDADFQKPLHILYTWLSLLFGYRLTQPAYFFHFPPIFSTVVSFLQIYVQRTSCWHRFLEATTRSSLQFIIDLDFVEKPPTWFKIGIVGVTWGIVSSRSTEWSRIPAWRNCFMVLRSKY